METIVDDPKVLPYLADDEVNLPNLIAKMSRSNLQHNVDVYDHYFSPLYKAGQLLFHRKILSPIDRRVMVFNEQENEAREMIMMGSNNYIGLANDPLVKEKVISIINKNGVGMGGPMLLNGTSQIHRELELKLAKFKNQEDCVLLPSGYMANLTWITTLVGQESLIIYDEYSHASVVDGIRLGGKKAIRFSHNDVFDLEKKLKTFRSGRNPNRDIFVTVQGVYSMNGELAPIPEIVELCEEYNAELVIDDAHGTGVMGRGRGVAEEFGVESKLNIAMGTLSKAFSVTGGFIAGNQKTINYLRFMARPYFFSASLSPMVIGAILAGLEIIETQPERIEKLHQNAKGLRKRLSDAGIKIMDTAGAIIPVFPENSKQFRQISFDLHQAGLFVNAIEPPGVPKGTERFRVTVMSSHTTEDLDEATRIIRQVFSKYASIK